MKMLNRSAISVKLKQDFVNWINALEPESNEGVDLSLEEVNQESTTYLIPELDETQDWQDFVEEHFQQIFANELKSWEENAQFWPDTQDLQVFQRWLAVEPSVMVFDLDLQAPLTLIHVDEGD
ncbi:hypothetical protein SAMN05421831_11539 [Allopseudospirillum japonicum]|uniref:VacJ n=1 Tax=Allopseudospirillum japonicum TaxID=64971 RepID=A0A1H6U886_9GAMM|nr:hypothetical protein [Allopseudospirillum japonicum]SEI88541.1 hypothetical protein SAMN05421831_11539 [Allopseudospirillum japonicum]